MGDAVTGWRRRRRRRTTPAERAETALTTAGSENTPAAPAQPAQERQRRRGWLPPLLTCASSLLIIGIRPAIPMLIALPLVILVVAGSWRQVLACGVLVAAATYLLIDVPTRVAAPGTVAKLVAAAAVSAAGVAWLRQRYLDDPVGAPGVGAWVYRDDGCEPLTQTPRIVVLPGVGGVLWAPGAGRTRTLAIAGDSALPAASTKRVLFALLGPMPLAAAADLIDAELADRQRPGAPQLTLIEIDSAHQLNVTVRGGPQVLHVRGTGTSVVDSAATGVTPHRVAEGDQVAVLLGTGSFDPRWAASLPPVHSLPADLAAPRLLTFAGEIDAPHEALLLLARR